MPDVQLHGTLLFVEDWLLHRASTLGLPPRWTLFYQLVLSHMVVATKLWQDCVAT